MRLFFTVLSFVFLISISAAATHPVYVTVTEIEHNIQASTLEISCKFFTDDLEKALRLKYKERIDLQDAGYTEAMNRLLSKYIPEHLQLTSNQQKLTLKYVGYEIISGETYAYFESALTANLNKLAIHQDLLFDFQEQQLGIVHVVENGKTKSEKLQNPDADASFSFPL